MRALELTGQRFGRLTVIKRHLQNTIHGNSRWNCICDCGNEVTVIGCHLTNGSTVSCNCYQKERTSETHFIHGLADTTEYNIWRLMINRCIKEDHESYKDYGGRGITVCDRWLNSFEAFYEDMGSRPSLVHTLDRRDNDLGYYKENCRWGTPQEQANNRRNSVFHTHNGITKTIAEWSKEYGIEYYKLYKRLFRDKWDFERAVNTP